LTVKVGTNKKVVDPLTEYHEIMDLLISRGAKIDTRNSLRGDAITYAVYLIKAGYNDAKKRPALYIGARLLLDKGASTEKLTDSSERFLRDFISYYYDH